MHLAAVEGPRANAIPTAWPWNSMVYAAWTSDGVVVIDLGWTGAGGALRDGLRELGAGPEDVRHVFLTHSHRDHVGGWRLVRHASFHLAGDERALFEGRAHHPDLLSRLGDALLPDAGPRPDQVRVQSFSADTVFALGRDTLRAFVVPGHTAGSAAYLFRGVLFAGDAVHRSYLTGYGTALPLFSADDGRNRESIRWLVERLRPYHVEWMCTAHAKCARYDARLLHKLLR